MLCVRLDPRVLSYFLNDSIMSYFNEWGNSELTLKGDYSKGKGEVEMLTLNTGTSLIEGKGSFYDIIGA